MTARTDRPYSYSVRLTRYEAADLRYLTRRWRCSKAAALRRAVTETLRYELAHTRLRRGDT